jgi:hypothetical protein
VRYYDETKMAGIREAVDAVLTKWPKVTRTLMFGCPCYKAGGRLFAFLVTGGIVLTRLSPEDRATAGSRFKARPFNTGIRAMDGWPQLPLARATRLKGYLLLMRCSYNSALAASRERARPAKRRSLLRSRRME